MSLYTRVQEAFQKPSYREQGPLGFGVESEILVIDPDNPGTMSGAVDLVRAFSETPTMEVMLPKYQALLATDAGMGTIEVAYDPMYDLSLFQKQSTRLNEELIRKAASLRHVLLGSGRQPAAVGSPHSWVPKERYGALREYLINGGHETTETASLQLTVDARSMSHLMAMVTVGNALAGPIAAVCANSPVFHRAVHHDQQASRVSTWGRISPESSRVGIPTQPASTLEEYVAWLVQDHQYAIHFFEEGGAEVCNASFEEAVARYGEDSFEHMLSCHIGCVWPDARIRLNKVMSVEWRVPCAQPQGEMLPVVALLLGLAEEAENALDLVSDYSWGDWRTARTECANFGMDARVAGTPVKEILWPMLDLAKHGLMNRGLGEERYLEDIEERITDAWTPARRQIELFANGGISRLIHEFSYKENTCVSLKTGFSKKSC